MGSRKRPIILLAILTACTPVKEPPPTEFEARCNRILRDILPDVHAVLGEGIGRTVRVREPGRETPGASHVAITLDPERLAEQWARRGVDGRIEQDRELSLELALHVVLVYQASHHPWMRNRADAWSPWPEDSMQTFHAAKWPSLGHAVYVSSEVARRRGTTPLLDWSRRDAWTPARQAWFRESWHWRETRLWSRGHAECAFDAHAWFQALVRRHGRAGALRSLRVKRVYTQSELLWPGDPEPGEDLLRQNLRALIAPLCAEPEVTRCHPRIFEDLLSVPVEGVRGWKVEARMLSGDPSSSARLMCFPVGEAGELLRAARRSIEPMASACDVAALDVRDVPDGFVADAAVTSLMGGRQTEIWVERDGWLVVFSGKELLGGEEWAETWIDNVLRVLAGDGDTTFRADGWVERWQEAAADLDSMEWAERRSALVRLLDDPSPHVRARAIAHGVRSRDMESLAARLRTDAARPVRLALGLAVDAWVGADEPNAESRALVLSLLTDPDPFVRAGCLDWRRPATGDDAVDEWNLYWRYRLTDPAPALRAEALRAISFEPSVYADYAPAELLPKPVPGRPTVETAVGELLDHPLYGDEALEFLIRLGSEDSRLWLRLVKRLREPDAESDFDWEPSMLLKTCPVPGGNRRAALDELARSEPEPIRSWASEARALPDE